MFLAAKEFPLPVEYRFLPLEEVFHEPPADIVDRDGGLPRLRQHRPDAGRLPAAATAPRSSTSTTTTTTPASATVNLVDIDASCTAEIVYELAKLLGVELTPEIAGGPLRRRWSPTPASSCTRTPTPATHRMAAELIEAGVDVNDTYRRLYERRADREARGWSPAPSSGSSATTTAGSPSPTSPPTTTRRPGAERGADRGDHRPPALDRGRQGRGGDPRQDRRRPGGAQGEPALHRRHGRRLGDRPQARRRRPQARRRLLDRPGLRRAGRVPLRRGQAQLSSTA